jgi:hypothetical protein
MNPNSANKMLVSTDFDTDKIVYVNSGSMSVSNGGSGTDNIPHPLGFRPLLVGYWSTSPTFTPRYPFSDSLSASGIAAAGFMATDSISNIKVVILNSLGSTTTFYYRMYGYAPHDYLGEVSPTSSVADSFIYDTDFIMPKLFDANRITIGAGNSYSHGLGYIPKVLVWEMVGSQEAQYDYLLDKNKVSVSTTSLVFTKAPLASSANQYSFRIYTERLV